MYLRGAKTRWFCFTFLLGVVFSLTIAVRADAQEAIPIVRPADAAVLHGGCEVDPFEVLIARYSLPRDTHTGALMRLRPTIGPDGVGRNGINPTLACRLMKLFQAVEKEQGCLIKIVSAYRTDDEQDRMCGSGGTGCLAAGKSCHNYGLGVDVEGSCVERLRAYLGKRQNTEGARRFGLHFPYSGKHIQCVENPVASCRPGIKGCDGKFAIQADTSGFPAAVPPTSAFAQSIRQWFSPPQQTTVPVQPAIPSQPASASQNPLNAFNESENVNEIGGVSSQINTGTISSGSSTAADRLEELAFGPKPATTTTATSVPLVVSGSNALVLSGGQNTSPAGVTPTTGVISPSQTTFVSGDLSWQGANTVSSAPVSGFQAILLTIKATLTRILYYLTPFRSQDLIHLDDHGEFEALE